MSKECSGFNGGPGSFCMIKSSNLKAIEVDSKILYLQPEKLFTAEGSDVILDPPGPGNHTAFGHCSLALGLCTFSGGTGKFTLFRPVSMSRTILISRSGSGKGRTASVRRIERNLRGRPAFALRATVGNLRLHL